MGPPFFMAAVAFVGAACLLAAVLYGVHRIDGGSAPHADTEHVVATIAGATTRQGASVASPAVASSTGERADAGNATTRVQSTVETADNQRAGASVPENADVVGAHAAFGVANAGNFASATSVIQASFDCGKAVSKIEKLICSTPETADADRRLNAAYSAARSKTNDPVGLKDDQRQWLKERNACDDAACLLNVSQVRIERLSAM